MKTAKKTFWTNAAEAGGVIGLAIFAIYMLDALFKLDGLKGGVTAAIFLVLFVLIYLYTKKRSLKDNSPEGFTYGRSMGFILAMMLFAGFVVGLGNVLLQNFLAPEYYEAQFNAALESNSMFDQDSENMEQAISLSLSLMKNPIVMVLSGMIEIVIKGGLVGLIVSIFVKRAPNVFGQDSQDGQGAI